MSEVKDLLKKSGYSEKAIEYYINKVNVGEMENPDADYAWTGPCGDTMEFQLRIKNDTIQDAKFRAIGCAGSFSAGSALTEMIKGKKLEEAKKIDENK
ncbi:MAG: iron-sulfur cluster assembly scaffold protein [Candidatus Jordarchaeum sp.]|uniref:iron-sulfur cluster assembly scaffold protein n=1 Tax=Candidatus Jordarchaeum sp. TaxID=2823881 RepID=UPI0040496752